MIGMLAALLLIWCAFDIASGILRGNFGGLLGGSFLTPRNLWTLLVQTSSIAVMSTGMVLLIVMRQLDLSVGSMLSLVAVAGAVLQVFKLVPVLGVGHPAIWIIAVVFCIALGALVGAFNGALTAYAKIPAFIVTLGGLLAYSGLAFYLAKGETVAPMDKTYEIFGGGIPISVAGPVLELDRCRRRLRGHLLCHRQRPPPAPALQVSAAAGVGRSLSRRSRQRRRARHHRRDELLSLAVQAHRELRQGQRCRPFPPASKTGMATPSAWRASRWCAAPKA